MAELLIVVDVQRCFINQFTQHIPGRVRRLIETRDYSPIIYTLFQNVSESPYRSLV